MLFKVQGDIRGIYARYHLSLFRLDKLIVDEDSGRLLIFAAIGGCELNEKVRHIYESSGRIIELSSRAFKQIVLGAAVAGSRNRHRDLDNP